MSSRNKSVLTAVIVLMLTTLACGIDETPTPAASIPLVAEASQATPEIAEQAAPAAPAIPAACANPYLPVITGATWNYRLTGLAADTFTRTIVSVEQEAFIDRDTFSAGLTRQGRWRCSNGNLIALDPTSGTSASIIAEGIWVEVQTTALEGVTIPAVINPGDRWTQSLTLEGTLQIQSNRREARNQIFNTCTAAGVEVVTVPAGNFEAMRVNCQIVINVFIRIEDKPNQTALTLNISNWYAPNIGLVRTTTAGEDLDGTVELLSVTFPQ